MRFNLNNIDLLNFCFKHGEDYIDDNYSKEDQPIIVDSDQDANSLMRANKKIQDYITAYEIALDNRNKEMQEDCINSIFENLETKGINFSEFTSYWAVKDVSFSVYKNTLKSKNSKLEFLRNILPDYINNRHNLYKSHGYSYSTLQTLSDSKSHKQNGNSGSIKVSKIFESFGFKPFDLSANADEFVKSNKVFLEPDKKGKTMFKEIIKNYDLNFDWSKNHENKQTDFLFKINDQIFIMEHKHMKESGGGQDKQMTEIIDFISYSEPKVSYVSFLDGIYFNLLADETIKKGKTFEQREKIKTNLEKNKQNYFINTIGFKKLLEAFD